MNEANARTSQLRIRTGVVAGRAATIILIDGVDVLDLQHATQRPDGSEYPDGRATFLPPNPMELLPPDSAALLPTAAPKHAMIGVCTCGEPGCKSLWLQVRRHGGEVVWEPDPDTPSHTVDTGWRFSLRQYLDAVDEAQRSTTRWETRPIRIARELRRRRDSAGGLHMTNSVTGKSMRLLDARAWPDQDYVLIDIASDSGLRQLHFDIDTGRTDQEIIWQLHSIDPSYDRVPQPVSVDRARTSGVVAAASTDGRGGARIVVGSKNFTEQLMLGELYTQALRAKGFDVALRGNLGDSQALSRALDRGLISVYPEYTGVIYTDLAQVGGRQRTARAVYEAAEQWEQSRGYTMLEPSASQTTGCLVVRRSFAREHALTTIGDLRRLTHFTYGGSPKLAHADGLRLAYALGNFTFRPIGFGGQYRELDKTSVDAIACVATDGQLAGDDYLVLADTEKIFGFGQVAPVVKQSLLAIVPPAFAATLNEVTGLLSPEAMIALNKATDLDKKEPAAVARTFLDANGLLR